MPYGPLTCYQLLHRSEKCYDQHLQPSVPSEHCKYEVFHVFLLTISPMMPSTTCRTLQIFYSIAFFLLLKLKSMSSVNYIELLIRYPILLITYTLRSYSLLNPFSFSLLITFPIEFRLIIIFRLLITMLQLPNEFL